MRFRPTRGTLGRLGLLVAVALAGSVGVGCAHPSPVRPWQSEHLAKRPMRFDDGLETMFRQHLFYAREGAFGGYGDAGGGCGCN